MARRRIVRVEEKARRGAKLRRAFQASRGAAGHPKTQTELAAAVGLTPQQISKYVQGRDLITPTWAYRFACSLGCRVLDILSETPAPAAEAPSGVAETAAPFLHVVAPQPDDLRAVLLHVEAHLHGEPREVLTRLALEVLEDAEAAPRVAKPKAIL
jgi:transcriptional regulator with XRE-family HTH domain